MRWSLLLCCGAGAVSSATAANAEGPYVGVEGGLYIQQPLPYNFVGLSNFFSTKYAKGIDIAGKAGYDFEGVRVEGEIAYKRATANQFGFSIDGQPLAVQKGSAVSGNLNTISAMVNGYWDITQGRLRPYVGGGVGIARIASSKVGYAGYGDSGIFLDKSNVGFAFNLMAGVKARITRRVYANVGYKFSDVEHFRLRVFNTSATSSVRSSSVLVGLSFSFGRSANDAPPPPRPPALPPPPEDLRPAQPISTTFNISFASGSSALNEDATITVDQIMTAYQKVGRASVMVFNVQAGTALAPYDEQLASRRAAALKDSLIHRGVPPSGIIVQSFDTPPSGPLPVVVQPAAFVIISFGPGSGQ